MPPFIKNKHNKDIEAADETVIFPQDLAKCTRYSGTNAPLSRSSEESDAFCDLKNKNDLYN